MDRSTRLTPNFTFGEFVTTTRHALADTNFREAQRHLPAIQATADLLQSVRDSWGRIKVNSGFRGPRLNDAIGGSKTSQHMKGEAVDFVPLDADMKEVFDWIVDESGLNFSQAILEGGSGDNATWIHLGLGTPWFPAHKCGQALRWTKADGYSRLR